jgi:hypothetical protein
MCKGMADMIETLRNTLQRVEQLLTRFELDTAAQVHAIDYRADIALLCEEFATQIRDLQTIDER